MIYYRGISKLGKRSVLESVLVAGVYVSRSRAAYWDGRNEVGEEVASGVYYYQLLTPEFQQIRQMVVFR